MRLLPSLNEWFLVTRYSSIVGFQHLICPLAELHTALAFHTIAYRDNDIETVKGDGLLYTINV